MISIGMIAKQYGMLPSQVRELGSTYDLMIYDVMMSWEQYQQDKANGTMSIPNLSQEQLLAILNKDKKQ